MNTAKEVDDRLNNTENNLAKNLREYKNILDNSLEGFLSILYPLIYF